MLRYEIKFKSYGYGYLGGSSWDKLSDAKEEYLKLAKLNIHDIETDYLGLNEDLYGQIYTIILFDNKKEQALLEHHLSF
mgnify:FL=1